MSIRITMVSGETVDTSRHTHKQATAAKAAGVGIEVGGVQELGWAEGSTPGPVDFDELEIPPVRTLYPEGIASIEDVSA